MIRDKLAFFQELLGAAMGITPKSDLVVRKKTKLLTKFKESSTFAVTQPLVSLLTQKGWISKMVRSFSSSKFRGRLYFINSKETKLVSSSECYLVY